MPVTNFSELAIDTGLKATYLDRRHTIEEFEVPPVVVQTDGTVPSGVDAEVNVMAIGSNVFEMANIGTQTIIVPVLEADGLDIGRDLTDNDGCQVSQGILARSKSAFTIGTDAFYLKVTFKIADMSGTDDCFVGFRKTAAYQAANLDDYTDFAGLNVILGDIKVETALNNAATTTTDATDNWLDTESHTLEVYVSKAGAATYKIDGAAPTATAAFTFDSGDVVVPHFHFSTRRPLPARFISSGGNAGCSKQCQSCLT